MSSRFIVSAAADILAFDGTTCHEQVVKILQASYVQRIRLPMASGLRPRLWPWPSRTGGVLSLVVRICRSLASHVTASES